MTISFWLHKFFNLKKAYFFLYSFFCIDFLVIFCFDQGMTSEPCPIVDDSWLANGPTQTAQPCPDVEGANKIDYTTESCPISDDSWLANNTQSDHVENTSNKNNHAKCCPHMDHRDRSVCCFFTVLGAVAVALTFA